MTPPFPPSAPLPRGGSGKYNIGDRLFAGITRSFAAVILIVVLLMAWEMYRASGPAIAKFGWRFLTSVEWDPVRDEFGALPFIIGTVETSILALLIAFPLGIGVAVFLSELAPAWLERPLSVVVELLAAIPSIVYGLWGIVVLVPWLRMTGEPMLRKYLGFLPLFHGPPYGFGILAAGIILALMILPIIASISRDVLRSVPASQREAAYALGATRWETIRIILLDARSGILGATLLGLGRAAGETMAVTMVIGNRVGLATSLFDPSYSMASVIANEFTEASSPLYTSALIELALILFGMTIILNATARLIVWSVTRRYRTA